MKNFFVGFIFAILATELFAGLSFFSEEMGVIYGSDDRYDIKDLNHSFSLRSLSASVSLVLEKSKIESTSLSRYKKLVATPLRDSQSLCSSERFINQMTVGFCTAFLVSKDVVMTAGHCLLGRDDCVNLAFVFDYSISKPVDEGEVIRTPTNNIYYCKEVLYHRDGRLGDVDLALIRLNRKATHRKPLEISAKKKVSQNAKFVVFGHPLGLPLKVIKQSSIIENSKKNYFTADIDAYSGNSGSPVINKKTGLVEGMLVRGQEDFERKGDCYISSRCNRGLCGGEEVLRAFLLKKSLSSVLLR